MSRSSKRWSSTRAVAKMSLKKVKSSIEKETAKVRARVEAGAKVTKKQELCTKEIYSKVTKQQWNWKISCFEKNSCKWLAKKWTSNINSQAVIKKYWRRGHRAKNRSYRTTKGNQNRKKEKKLKSLEDSIMRD